jgi:hypothetical protein
MKAWFVPPIASPAFAFLALAAYAAYRALS